MTRGTKRVRSLAWATLVAATVFVSAACGNSNQPSPIDLTGSWSGTATDSSGPGSIAWRVTQSGSAFSGTLTITDDSSGAHGRGSVSGTVSGTAMEFSITIPAGGFDEPWGACTANLTGSATVTTSSFAGTYAGSNSCAGSVSAGQLTLNRS